MAQRYETRDVTYTEGRRSTDSDDRVELTSPTDRIRWASVLGGLFTFLAALIFFTVLGLALGLSTLDADNPRSFGIGAGIYGAVSAILAFLLGGFISAKTTKVVGTGNAILNGAMVWIVALPLIVNFLTSGIGSILGTATDLATTAAQTAAEVAAPAVGQAAEEVASDPAAQATAAEGAAAVQESAEAAVQDVQQQVQNIQPEDVEQVARDVSGAAWGTLLALGLTALASIFGGLLGRRTYPTEVAIAE